MISIKSLIAASFLFVQILPSHADFGDFLQTHQEQVKLLFTDINLNLHGVRQGFQHVLLWRSTYPKNLTHEMVNGLRANEAGTIERLDQAKNSSCIQHLRNILTNTRSLTAIQMGTCLRHYYDESAKITREYYNQLAMYQHEVNNLPILFTTEMQDDNVWDYEKIVINQIENGLATEVQRLQAQFEEFTRCQRPAMEVVLTKLFDSYLVACFEDMDENFNLMLDFVNDRFTTVCVQDDTAELHELLKSYQGKFSYESMDEKMKKWKNFPVMTDEATEN